MPDDLIPDLIPDDLITDTRDAAWRLTVATVTRAARTFAVTLSVVVVLAWLDAALNWGLAGADVSGAVVAFLFLVLILIVGLALAVQRAAVRGALTAVEHLGIGREVMARLAERLDELPPEHTVPVTELEDLLAGVLAQLQAETTGNVLTRPVLNLSRRLIYRATLRVLLGEDAQDGSAVTRRTVVAALGPRADGMLLDTIRGWALPWSLGLTGIMLLLATIAGLIAGGPMS